MPENEEHGHVCECGESFQNPDRLQCHIQRHKVKTGQEHTFREPNRDEILDLFEWYVKNYQDGYDRAVDTINQSYYILIEDYVTGCPGYTGKLLIEIGNAGPSHYNVYTWINGDIQRRNRAEELNEAGETDGEY